MPIATVTSKGQITIPAQVRKRLGLRPGSKISFEECNGAYLIAPADADPLEKLWGCLRHDGPPVTVEAMNRAIADYVAQSVGAERRSGL